MKTTWWLLPTSVAALVLACPKPPPAATTMSSRPECPHTWTDTSGHALAPSGKDWLTVNVPEFNDCQRFILESGGKRFYTTGYFAIFAYSDTNSLSTRLLALGGRDVTTGVLVAYIYAESNDYGDLQLKVGGNCLYLHQDRKAWRLATVRRPFLRDDKLDCQRSDTLRQDEAPLPVRSQSVSTVSAGDYPNVARWDWDQKRGHQIAGVRCDAQWCDVGGTPAIGGHPDLARSTSRREHRTTDVRGWYDEQYLARCSSATECRPTALLGTVIPDSALDTATAYPDTFVLVARIAIRVDPSVPEAVDSSSDLLAYRKKGLSPTPSPKKLNLLFLCHGDGKTCFTGTPPGCPTVPEEVEHGQWWYRIVSAKDDTTAGCYARRTSMASGGVHVAGAARWRWILNDETNWIRCVEGCCEVQR